MKIAAALSFFCLLILWCLTGCTRFELLDATIPSDNIRTSNLAYGPLPRQKLDVYQPRHASPNAGVVLFFYGGDWQSGRKEDYRFVAQALTSQGFIAVLPDYRLYPDVTFPAFVEDGALAVRWAHDHAAQFGGDPRHIYLMGHSAGAHIAALLTLDEHYLHDVGLDRSTIRATAALSGPYDFIPWPGDLAVFSMNSSDSPIDPRMEPIHFADGHAPPMLLVHGLKDQIVSPQNAANLAAAIHQKGGDVRYIAYPNRGHAEVVMAFAWPFRWLAPTLHDVTTFFHEH